MRTRIAFAVIVWSSCISMVSACDLSHLTTSCGLPKSTMIGIIAGGAALIILAATYSMWLRRRRLRNRVRLSNAPYDGLRLRSSNAPKSYRAPHYPVYYQAAPPAPLPVHTPQYPPRGYDTPYQNHPRLQRVPPSPVRTIPEPIAPISPMSMRAPSSISSRPISSLNTTPPSLRPSVYRNESAPFVPMSPTSLSPRSTQRSVTESPLLPPPSSLPPQNPPFSAVFPPSPRPSAAIPPPNTAPPLALVSMHTGTLQNNTDEPPPAYTPIEP